MYLARKVPEKFTLYTYTYVATYVEVLSKAVPI